MEPKAYFHQPTAAEIRKYGSVRGISDNLVDNISNLDGDEAVVIRCSLIPERYQSPQKFMKHGDEVKIRRFNSLEEAVAARLTPLCSRRTAFEHIRAAPYCGYSFKPFIGTDRRTRRVPLIECLEGAHIYCYANQNRSGTEQGQSLVSSHFPSYITIRPYDDSQKVKIEGAEVVVSVPSRTKRTPKYHFKFRSVPLIDSTLIDSRYKWGIASGIATDHNCGGKIYENLKYNRLEDKESSSVFTFCAHEIAGYLAVIDFYVQRDKNRIPLQMSPFAIPTQKTIDYYSRLRRNCLIKTPNDEKPRKLNRAEKEILLWGLVHKLGHDQTFFPRKKLRDYNWG